MSFLNVFEAMFNNLIGSSGALLAIFAAIGVLLGWGVISILRMFNII